MVIVTDLPRDESTPDYWAELAAALPSLAFGDDNLIPGVPPVAAIHHEFTQYNQLRELQRIHGMEGQDLNGDVVDELFEVAVELLVLEAGCELAHPPARDALRELAFDLTDLLVEAVALELAAEPRDLMLVGHLPFMNDLASRLVCGDASADAFVFTPGTAVCLERVPGSRRFCVRWVVNPETVCAR